MKRFLMHKITCCSYSAINLAKKSCYEKPVIKNFIKGAHLEEVIFLIF